MLILCLAGSCTVNSIYSQSPLKNDSPKPSRAYCFRFCCVRAKRLSSSESIRCCWESRAARAGAFAAFKGYEERKRKEARRRSARPTVRRSPDSERPSTLCFPPNCSARTNFVTRTLRDLSALFCAPNRTNIFLRQILSIQVLATLQYHRRPVPPPHSTESDIPSEIQVFLSSGTRSIPFTPWPALILTSLATKPP